ncbi:MAG: dephospho-CoA kinase [Paludibacteraceae bacterium]|nr:dephospho-CoA kinase [Paludibacteraceae bacterium]
MQLFGITGGIGSGKSTVAHALQQLGYNVYYTDCEAQRIINHNDKVRKQIELLFGKDIYINNTFDKQKVAKLVFNNTQLLLKLNAVVHPAVIEDIKLWSQKQHDIAFVESAIIFESGINQICKAVINIAAPLQTRIQRTVIRDHTTPQRVIKRINNQMPDHIRAQLADLNLNNNDNTQLSQLCLDILKFCRGAAVLPCLARGRSV